MDMVLVGLAALFGLLTYVFLGLLMKDGKLKDFVCSASYLSPNLICAYRLLMGYAAMGVFFISNLTGMALFIYFAFLDTVDGMVARRCKSASSFGEFFDPLADKLLCIPPMVYFTYVNGYTWLLIYVFIISEIINQFFARKFLSLMGKSMQANNFGKIKTTLCFCFIAYAYLSGDLGLRFGNQLLAACVVMSIASFAFKLIDNRYYANILSLLNLICGLLGIYFALNAEIVYASLAVIAGQVFDLFDGRMARKYGETAIGEWLDDVADFISFGLVPAFVAHVMSRGGIGSLAVPVLYVFAVIFRLVRFIKVDKKDPGLPDDEFKGLPSPAGSALALGSCLVFAGQAILLLMVAISAGLMVSRLRFLHFGKAMISRIPKVYIVFGGSIFIVLFSYLIREKDPIFAGYLFLSSIALYMAASFWLIQKRKTGHST